MRLDYEKGTSRTIHARDRERLPSNGFFLWFVVNLDHCGWARGIDTVCVIKCRGQVVQHLGAQPSIHLSIEITLHGV